MGSASEVIARLLHLSTSSTSSTSSISLFDCSLHASRHRLTDFSLLLPVTSKTGINVIAQSVSSLIFAFFAFFDFFVLEYIVAQS
jgi:hypothetical protein